MKGSDGDHSPSSMPKGSCNVFYPIPGEDGSKEGDPHGEANVGGSRSENTPQLAHGRWINRLPRLLVNMKIHCLSPLSTDPISEPLAFGILAIWG